MNTTNTTMTPQKLKSLTRARNAAIGKAAEAAEDLARLLRAAKRDGGWAGEAPKRRKLLETVTKFTHEANAYDNAIGIVTAN